jgi:hypothetical protein
MLKFLDNHIVVFRAQQMLKFSKDVFVFSGVEFGVVFVFEFLELEEKILKFFCGWNFINFNSKYSLTRFKAFSLLAHSSIMDRISLILVLNCEHFSVSVNDIFGVLLKEIKYSNIELLMPLNRIRIMKYLTRQVPMLYIHILEPVLVFVLDQLVVECLFQIHSLNIKNNYHAIVVSSVAETMISIPPFLISINFLMDDIRWCPHFSK